MAQETIFTWEGRSIRLSYSPRWSDTNHAIDHVEVQTLDGNPLPITETGYRSHFFGPVEPALSLAEVQDMVIAWIDKDAASPTWKRQQLASQQLSLF